MKSPRVREMESAPPDNFAADGDNRAKTKATDFLKRDWSSFRSGNQRRQPGQIIDYSPPEPPVEITMKEGHALPVHIVGDSREDNEDLAWLIALVIAIVGLILIILFVGPTIYQQVFWALVLLTLVIAIKR